MFNTKKIIIIPKIEILDFNNTKSNNHNSIINK